MSSEIDWAAIREALGELPALAATSPGRPPAPEEIYFPPDHARALDPETLLVVGNRGMGKSFWANALAGEETRKHAARAYPEKLRGVEARFVFASAEGGEHGVSQAEIKSVGDEVSPESIWRAAILGELPSAAGLPKTLRDRVAWIGSHPEEQRTLLRDAVARFAKEGRRVVFLFDALDQLADEWQEIQKLTQGLLRLALALTSYRAIRLKIFMRSDQFESTDLFRFPDASKITNGSVRLTWKSVDLYGLLFFELKRREENAFTALCRSAAVNLERRHDVLGLPLDLLTDPEVQKVVFHRIAGPYMGKNAKRGFPYTWLHAHLADAKGEVGPRTFLRALREAAHHDPAPAQGAIDHHGIQNGVRKASEQRLEELKEDYPWVSEALEPLRGLLVPSEWAKIRDCWRDRRVLERIQELYPSVKSPLGLDLGRGEDVPRSLQVLLANLVAIGVMERRANGKIDVPDIFRVKAGILRKGGVTPQQRQRR